MRSEPSERIDRRIVQVWRIRGVLEVLVLVAVGIGLSLLLVKLFHRPGWVPALAMAAVVIYGGLEIAVLTQLRWERWRYQVSKEEIYLQRGVWFIKRTLIPMTRIQHVDTVQGILMRRYGLAAVNVSTAAGTHQIPALSEEMAGELRDRIASLARVSSDAI